MKGRFVFLYILVRDGNWNRGVKDVMERAREIPGGRELLGGYPGKVHSGRCRLSRQEHSCVFL